MIDWVNFKIQVHLGMLGSSVAYLPLLDGIKLKVLVK